MVGRFEGERPTVPSACSTAPLLTGTHRRVPAPELVRRRSDRAEVKAHGARARQRPGRCEHDVAPTHAAGKPAPLPGEAHPGEAGPLEEPPGAALALHG